ncbi:MAG: halocyanin domain-containing protein [Euryarchaeota archaeon]|nr:halocyanin domain-containing protein [Euryarchaeota archaeon]
MSRTPRRRQMLQSAAAVGLLSVAGCLSAAGDSPEPTATSSESTDEYTQAAEIEPPESVDEWLKSANGYTGDRIRTGTHGRADIHVGHEYDDGLGFDPVVVEVSPNTIVRWNWTGHGGVHNVVALDGTFDSGRPNAQPGTSYQYVFEEPGTYPFVSEPDRDDGMKGLVIVDEPPSTGYETVDEWVVHSSNFDGEITDRTDAETASVTVGAEGNGSNLAFSPPVLRISPDTTVTWEWSAESPSATVSFEDSDIDSGEPTSDTDTTFEHTFDETGIYRYASLPHKSIGMRGAIIVEQ